MPKTVSWSINVAGYRGADFEVWYLNDLGEVLTTDPPTPPGEKDIRLGTTKDIIRRMRRYDPALLAFSSVTGTVTIRGKSACKYTFKYNVPLR